MKNVKVCLDTVSLPPKPSDDAIDRLNRRIAKTTKQLNPNNIRDFVADISANGYSFCPATFTNGSKERETFEQQQLFALDFTGGISWQELFARSKKYNIPLLFAHTTSADEDPKRFRALFMNDVPVTDIRAAQIIQNALMRIFPEADRKSGESTRTCLGNTNGIMSVTKSLPEIDIDSLTRNMTRYLKDTFGDSNYKRKISEFAQHNRIALNQNRLLDISLREIDIDRSEEDDLNKISPSTIILYRDHGENLSNLQYQINLEDSSAKDRVSKKSSQRLHKRYRSSTLDEIRSTCRLIEEFYSGAKEFSRWELQGIASNLVQIESGADRFMASLVKCCPSKHELHERWKFNLSYWNQQNCEPFSCVLFCPHKDTCQHGRNMLSKAKPSVRSVVPLANSVEEYHSREEAQKDVEQSLLSAMDANDTKWHIIKAQTSIGKTTAYLKLMAENPTKRFLIAVPTNLLKREVCHRAEKEKLFVKKTPSLEEIRDDMPDDVWEHIEYLRKTGRHHLVNPYVNKAAREQNIRCLKKYQKERQALEGFDGSVITTHRKLLTLDVNTLQQYDAVIVDEDIIMKSIIPNQGMITISDLKALLDATTDSKLVKKIKKVLNHIKTESLFTLPSIGWEWNEREKEGEGMPTAIDIPSFCMAEYFCYRKTSRERNLDEDCIVFFKPVSFKGVKHIMVSATADETICRYYFGEENVEFYTCKKTRYEGTLKQYPGMSMSRSCIDANPGIIQYISKRLAVGLDKTITFLKYHLGTLHFGNTEGSNILEGEDIVVIGTPYHAEFLYKLFGSMITEKFDRDSEMKSKRLCSHNGYSFRFTTFDDEVLRKIHFWMIESDIEQAIGRSRLLWHKCIVHLFSSFPVSQAVMVNDFDYGSYADSNGAVTGERKEAT